MTDLSEVCAIVTGASRGIGREVARLLLTAGATVVITGRDGGRLAQTSEELTRTSGTRDRIIAVAGDVSDENHGSEVAEQARAARGGIDLLINNAGLSMRGSVVDLTDETVRKLTDTNLRGSINMTIASLPFMTDRTGSVLFISTLAALTGFPQVSVYSATKMGLTAFAQSLRAETRGRGLHIGVVYLGFTENDADKTILDARGVSFHHQRSAMLTQERAANKILTAWRKRRRYDYTVPAGYALAAALRLAPRLTERVLASTGGSIHRVDRS